MEVCLDSIFKVKNEQLHKLLEPPSLVKSIPIKPYFVRIVMNLRENLEELMQINAKWGTLMHQQVS